MYVVVGERRRRNTCPAYSEKVMEAVEKRKPREEEGWRCFQQGVAVGVRGLSRD